METEVIIIKEYCRYGDLEPEFVQLLAQEGLVEIQWQDGQQVLPASQLPELEQYARMYYDLSINVEGISAITHLLHRMRSMQQELQRLKRHLRLFGPDEKE